MKKSLKIKKLKNKKGLRGGYAVLMVGVLFAMGMVIVSTQIAKQTINLRRSTNFSLEELTVGGYMDGVARQVLNRLHPIGSGYYELGTVIGKDLGEDDLREMLGLHARSKNQPEMIREQDLRVDYIAASVVPVPTAYSFTAGSSSNSFVEAQIVGNDINMGVVSKELLPDLGFYDDKRVVSMDICDPKDNEGGLRYNIFKRDKSQLDGFAAVLTPNFLCNNVRLRRDKIQDQNRVGTQMIVSVGKPSGSDEEPRFYYTVPNLGTGSAGRDCEVHKVYFEAKWFGSGEYIDPLDHPCNWNMLEKGDGLKFGLSSFSLDRVFDTVRLGGNMKGSLSMSGSNLESDLESIAEAGFYDGVQKDDVLVLRLRLRCVNGGSDCHPTDRFEFYDDEFLNEFSGARHAECEDGSQNGICQHTYSQLADFNLKNPVSDFTQLVFSYGLYDNGRYLGMRNDWNRANSRRGRLDFLRQGLFYGDIFDIRGVLSRNELLGGLSIDKLRSFGEFTASRSDLESVIETKSSKQSNLTNGPFHILKRSEYDNQTNIANFVINNMEFPTEVQGFRFDYEQYFHLYLLEDDLQRPEFVLNSLNDFIQIMNRKRINNPNYNTGPITYKHFEYQIVSSKIIGTEKGYVVYDYGNGKKSHQRDFGLEQVVEAGFVNVSN